MQVRLNKTVVGFYNNELDPVKKEKWSFNGQYPKNMQDVCDVIKSATFNQVLKRSRGRAVAYIASYIHFPASRMCTTKWVQEGVNTYLLENGRKVTLDIRSVTSKKFREHSLYCLAKNEAMQKYTACVLRSQHAVTKTSSEV